MTRERIGALFFLFLSVTYGLLSFRIPAIPIADLQMLSPAAFPVTLSIIGFVVSLTMLLTSGARSSDSEELSAVLRKCNWKQTGYLCLLMILYGFSLTGLGFVLATTCFLAVGFWILGERRKMLLLTIPPMIALAFWLLFTQFLGIYLHPGFIFENLLG